MRKETLVKTEYFTHSKSAKHIFSFQKYCVERKENNNGYIKKHTFVK